MGRGILDYMYNAKASFELDEKEERERKKLHDEITDREERRVRKIIWDLTGSIVVSTMMFSAAGFTRHSFPVINFIGNIIGKGFVTPEFSLPLCLFFEFLLISFSFVISLCSDNFLLSKILALRVYMQALLYLSYFLREGTKGEAIYAYLGNNYLGKFASFLSGITDLSAFVSLIISFFIIHLGAYILIRIGREI